MIISISTIMPLKPRSMVFEGAIARISRLEKIRYIRKVLASRLLIKIAREEREKGKGKERERERERKRKRKRKKEKERERKRKKEKREEREKEKNVGVGRATREAGC